MNEHPYLSLAFFATYAVIEFAHFIMFVAGECLYTQSSSILLMLINLACMLLLCPLSIHSPTEGWAQIQEERYCTLIPKWIGLVVVVLGWACCVCINLFLLSTVKDVSIVFLLVYTGSAIAFTMMMAIYAALFAFSFALGSKEEEENVPLQQLE